MTLKSTEDANQYIAEVSRHLNELTSLSAGAGLNSQASIWCGIHAAFLDSPDEIKTIATIIGMYAEGKIKQGFGEHTNCFDGDK